MITSETWLVGKLPWHKSLFKTQSNLALVAFTALACCLTYSRPLVALSALATHSRS